MSHFEPQYPFHGYDYIQSPEYEQMMDFICRVESEQADKLGAWLYRKLRPKSVIDVGCGPGIYLLPFQKKGCQIKGIDACKLGGTKIPAKDFERVDLRFPYHPGRRYDLAICFEVAEHLERHWSERLVDTLYDCADTIIFTGAVPGQGGSYHVNEQPHEFWLNMFRERHGYVLHPLQDEMRAFLSTLPDHCSRWLKDNSFLLWRRPFQDGLTRFGDSVKTLRRQGTERHAWAVYGLVRWLRPEVVVETGTYDGYVSAHIALALMHNGSGRLYTLDNGEYQDSPTVERLEANLRACGVMGDHVSIVHRGSLEWEWPERVDLAVLDGDRALPNFAEEVRRVVSSGARCFTLHDTHHDGNATRMYRAFKAEMPDWEVINAGFNGGFAIFLKAERGEPQDFTDWKPGEDAPVFELPNGKKVIP